MFGKTGHVEKGEGNILCREHDVRVKTDGWTPEKIEKVSII